MHISKIRVNSLLLPLSSLLLMGYFIALGACNSESVSSAVPDGGLIAAESQSLAAPNILFIYSDDQAPWAIGSSGNAQAITPNLDRLAAEGMSFPNAYTTTPVCSPSRASLLTSRYGYEVDIDDWLNPSARSLSGNDPHKGLDPSHETWPEVLQKAGYHTALIGKWHLGSLDKYHPSLHGYDEFFGFRLGGIPAVDPTIEVDGKPRSFEGMTDDILTQEAADFLVRNKGRRFALSLHYRAPHTPWLPVAPEDEAPYRNMDMDLPHPEFPGLDVERGKRMMREYLSSVRSIDRSVGRLLAKLEELGLTETTLVVFTSDHGYNMGHNGIWHKGNGFWLANRDRGSTENIPVNQRPNMYDNSIKVPTIVRWPGVVEPGSQNVSSMSNLDWFPTLVTIAKGSPGEQSIVRGKDFVPALLDKDKVLSTDYYAAYSTRHQTITDMRMYSDGRYKLVRDFMNEGRDEFYDLETDPEETRNLINAHSTGLQNRIDDLHRVILQKMAETNDPVLSKVN